jgi:hypothetical protein
MAVVVHLPLLWMWGPHYFYWPAALWALFNAGLWQYALDRWFSPAAPNARPEGEQTAAAPPTGT